MVKKAKNDDWFKKIFIRMGFFFPLIKTVILPALVWFAQTASKWGKLIQTRLFLASRPLLLYHLGAVSGAK
jgi:hypothetical protein